ncbi:Uncharacterized protein dnm_014350 [Desulfonema magnum]|uniref:Uncharacterized protein n=1 Tax=Desulfonema magnum TaxID=45655 RepID=A0A975BHA6_9BACT|nr:Uncharacterized protein dnm_014350 [Desulfonema magnum]
MTLRTTPSEGHPEEAVLSHPSYFSKTSEHRVREGVASVLCSFFNPLIFKLIIIKQSGILIEYNSDQKK